MKSSLQPPRPSLSKSKSTSQIHTNPSPSFQAPLKDSRSNQTAKRALEFKERFKKLHFYFDGVDRTVSAQLKSHITNLGGHIEQHLSRKITHIITGNPFVKEGTQRSYYENPLTPVADVVIMGSDWNMKVWPPSKLQSVIDTINQSIPRTQSSLQEALKNERMFGLSTNRTSQNFKVFKGYYILVEDPSGTYKPVTCKEYPREYDPDRPPWPIIYYDNHASHTVFAIPSQTSSRDPTENSSEVLPPTRESAASGLISGSAASVMTRNLGENPIIASMAQRTEQPQKRNRESETDFPFKKNPQGQKVNPALIPAKSGYCENCNVKFEDYQKHIKSVKHRKYAENEYNFQTLDAFFKKVERKKAVVNPVQVDVLSEVLSVSSEAMEDGDSEETEHIEEEVMDCEQIVVDELPKEEPPQPVNIDIHPDQNIPIQLDKVTDIQVEAKPSSATPERITKQVPSMMTPRRITLSRKENLNSPLQKIVLRFSECGGENEVQLDVDTSNSPAGVKRFKALKAPTPKNRLLVVESDSTEGETENPNPPVSPLLDERPSPGLNKMTLGLNTADNGAMDLEEEKDATAILAETRKKEELKARLIDISNPFLNEVNDILGNTFHQIDYGEQELKVLTDAIQIKADSILDTRIPTHTSIQTIPESEKFGLNKEKLESAVQLPTPIISERDAMIVAKMIVSDPNESILPDKVGYITPTNLECGWSLENGSLMQQPHEEVNYFKEDSSAPPVEVASESMIPNLTIEDSVMQNGCYFKEDSSVTPVEVASEFMVTNPSVTIEDSVMQNDCDVSSVGVKSPVVENVSRDEIETSAEDEVMAKSDKESEETVGHIGESSSKSNDMDEVTDESIDPLVKNETTIPSDSHSSLSSSAAEVCEMTQFNVRGDMDIEAHCVPNEPISSNAKFDEGVLSTSGSMDMKAADSIIQDCFGSDSSLSDVEMPIELPKAPFVKEQNSPQQGARSSIEGDLDRGTKVKVKTRKKRKASSDQAISSTIDEVSNYPNSYFTNGGRRIPLRTCKPSPSVTSTPPKIYREVSSSPPSTAKRGRGRKGKLGSAAKDLFLAKEKLVVDESGSADTENIDLCLTRGASVVEESLTSDKESDKKVSENTATITERIVNEDETVQALETKDSCESEPLPNDPNSVTEVVMTTINPLVDYSITTGLNSVELEGSLRDVVMNTTDTAPGTQDIDLPIEPNIVPAELSVLKPSVNDTNDVVSHSNGLEVNLLVDSQPVDSAPQELSNTSPEENVPTLSIPLELSAIEELGESNQCPNVDFSTAILELTLEESEMEKENDMKISIANTNVEIWQPIGKLTKTLSHPAVDRTIDIADSQTIISDSEGHHSPTSSSFGTPIKPKRVEEEHSKNVNTPTRNRLLNIRNTHKKSPLAKVLKITSMDELSSSPEPRMKLICKFPTRSNGIPIVQSSKKK